MGVSLGSALTIANNDTEIVISESNGKFAGAICHGVDHPHHPYMPILSTEYVFDTREAAQTSMEQTIVGIKAHVKKDFGE